MTLRFLSDEDFRGDILEALRLVQPTLDIVRVQDVGLQGLEDAIILEWSAQVGRLVLTHDRRTMNDYAYARVAVGLPMPGVIIMSQFIPVGRAIEEILYINDESAEGEWEGEVLFLPL